MHDVARDVAILIASKEEVGFKSFVRAGAELKGLLRGLQWEEYMRISLMRSRIDELPEGIMHCPNLLTLMMAENKELSEIKGWFFEETKGLRVLDLSNTAITRLPISLSNLLNLQVLCLRYCRFGKLGCLSPVGGLKQLESLDLSYNDDLCELPVELGELINLRSLNLTYTSSLAIVPHGIISRLAHLEELKMLGSFSKWEVGVKEEEARSSSNCTLAEVASLAELSCLCLHIADLDRFPQDYARLKSLEKLKKFHLYIYQSEYEMYAYTLSLGFTSDSFRRTVLIGCIPITRWVNMILQQTTQIALFHSKGLRTLDEFGNLPSVQKIHLFYCNDMECVFSAREAPATWLKNHVVHSTSFPRMENLTRLLVRECDRVEHVFAGTQSMLQDDVLPRLQSLSFENLKNMRSIWAMGLVGTFKNLAHLDFQCCTVLKKNALSSEQIKGGLPNLVELSVGSCYEIEEIISDVADNEGLLPKLRELRLYKLPELVRICGGNGELPLPQLDWHSLQEISVHKCPKLNKLLPLQRGAQGAPSLREVRGEKEWWETLDWDEDDDIKAYFQPFFIEERAQWDSFGEAT
ncbi:disease resistance protein At4g27190-like [Magnolia sinica]|uniref:disease resistance protein At4g27190-like n=1 Tax=Magnolia sinica TaxID=86752 RepID=UPI0026591C3C|nr:disease resistance protein At4g27190-like [Magnolia sinica]